MGLTAFNKMRREQEAACFAASPLILSDDELKEIAKERGIKGYYNMKRETLLKRLEGD